MSGPRKPRTSEDDGIEMRDFRKPAAANASPPGGPAITSTADAPSPVSSQAPAPTAPAKSAPPSPTAAAAPAPAPTAPAKSAPPSPTAAAPAPVSSPAHAAPAVAAAPAKSAMFQGRPLSLDFSVYKGSPPNEKNPHQFYQIVFHGPDKTRNEQDANTLSQELKRLGLVDKAPNVAYPHRAHPAFDRNVAYLRIHENSYEAVRAKFNLPDREELKIAERKDMSHSPRFHI